MQMKKKADTCINNLSKAIKLNIQGRESISISVCRLLDKYNVAITPLSGGGGGVAIFS